MMQNYLNQFQSPLGSSPPPYKGGWNVGSNALSTAFRSAASKSLYGLPVGEMGDAFADWTTGRQIRPGLYSNNLPGAIDQFSDQLPTIRTLKHFAGMGSQAQYDPAYEKWKEQSRQSGFFPSQAPNPQPKGYYDGGQVTPAQPNRSWQNFAGQFGQNMMHSLGNQFATYMGANPNDPYQSYQKPPQYQQWLDDMFYKYTGMPDPRQQQSGPQFPQQRPIEPASGYRIRPKRPTRTTIEHAYYPNQRGDVPSQNTSRPQMNSGIRRDPANGFRWLTYAPIGQEDSDYDQGQNAPVPAQNAPVRGQTSNQPQTNQAFNPISVLNQRKSSSLSNFARSLSPSPQSSRSPQKTQLTQTSFPGVSRFPRMPNKSFKTPNPLNARVAPQSPYPINPAFQERNIDQRYVNADPRSPYPIEPAEAYKNLDTFEQIMQDNRPIYPEFEDKGYRKAEKAHPRETRSGVLYNPYKSKGKGLDKAFIRDSLARLAFDGGLDDQKEIAPFLDNNKKYAKYSQGGFVE